MNLRFGAFAHTITSFFVPTRRGFRLVSVAITALFSALLTGCGGNGYLIDASEEGGEAFIFFAGVVVFLAFALFSMDRIRRRYDGTDPSSDSDLDSDDSN